MKPLPPVLLAAAAAALVVFACSSEPGPKPCTGDCSTPAKDAGSQDAGEDAGDAQDAGDAGATEDAGTVEDAGEDAGAIADAGDDAGVDAGEPDAGCGWSGTGPPNLLLNPGFECGAAQDGWNWNAGATLTTESANPHAGLQAAKLVWSGGTNASMSLFPLTPPVSQSGAKHYCASAWVLAATGTTAKITIQAQTGSGGLQETNFSAPMTGIWTRIAIDANTTAFDDKVTVKITMPSPASGATMLVDDVDLLVTANAVCPVR